MRRIVTDGGANASGYNKEENDCAVVAFSLVLDIPYPDAYKKLEAAGRESNNGFFIVEFMEHCMFKGYTVETIKYDKDDRPTQQVFTESHPTGSWIVYTKGHIVAVVDGVLYDNNLKPTKSRVQYAWCFSLDTEKAV